MKLDDQPAEIQTAFAFWQALRSLGFSSDDLWVGMAGQRVIVQVQQNGQGYTLAMGTTAMTQVEFERLWLNFAESLADIPEEDMKANCFKWVTEERWAEMLRALVMAGVTLPEKT